MVLLISSLALISIQLDSLSTSDTFEFREIALVPYFPSGWVTCGDADHDRLQELYARGPFPQSRSHILEFGPRMEYETTAIAVNWPQHFFVSDLDRDGKSELCLSYWEASSCSLFLFESYDSASLPLRRIWARPCNNTGFAIGGFDTDTDSALEFIWEDGNTGHIYVYECAGDDIYMLRTVLPETLFGYSDYNVCPDLDRDGKPEIFAGWSDMPYVVILETVGNDSFRIVAIESLPLYSYAIVYAVAGGPDIDRDGRTEALVMGVDFHSTGLLVSL